MRGKESFIVYHDWWELYFEPLSNDSRAALIFMIFNYSVYGMAPEREIGKDLTDYEMAFRVIRKTLDRDAEKWEKERQERSKAGTAGAKARWGKDSTV